MHPIDIAAAAIEQSLAAGGAYVTIPDAPGVIDALCERASDWFDLAIAQREGLAIGGYIESDEWNVFVAYAD